MSNSGKPYVSPFRVGNNSSGSHGVDEPSAVLQIEDSDGGFLPPRLTTSERDAIASPATGLQIHNISTGKPEFFDGTVWMEMGGGSVVAAADVTFTPAGGISATNVQSAIQELDTEKLAASHAGTGGTAHAAVTGSVNGFMISTDKSKLDGIPADAISSTEKGAMNGVATLDSGSKIPSGQLPTIAGSSITNTPAGSLIATNVQAAINELDTKKAPTASPTFTGTVSGARLALTATTGTTTAIASVEANVTSFTGASLEVKNTLVAGSSYDLIRGIADSDGTPSTVFRVDGNGAITSGTINKLTITPPATSATLTIANGKTLTASNTLILTGTDSSTIDFGTGGTVVYTGGNLSQFASTTSAQLASVISDETGTGALVFAGSPALTGTPTAPTASNGTNTTQIATTAFVQDAVSSGTAGVASFNTRTGIVTLLNTDVTTALGYTPADGAQPLSQFASTTSAQLASVISDETGSGALVFAASPTFTGTVATAALTAAGNVSVSRTTNDAVLIINANAGQNRQIIGRTAGSNRFTITIADSATESGTNAGSNFSIFNYDDSGSSLGASIQVFRSSGLVILGAQGGSSGSLRVTPVASATRYINIAGSNGGNPVIQTSAGDMSFAPAGTEQLRVIDTASATRYVTITGSNGGNSTISTSAGDLNISPTINAARGSTDYLQLAGGTGSVSINAVGASTDVSYLHNTKGVGFHSLRTGGLEQVRVINTASATRYLTLTGSNGGNPTIGTSAGDVAFSSNVSGSGTASFTTAVATNGSAGTNRFLSLTTGGSSRWRLNASSTAEGGSNAGTDFEILNFNDAGSNLGVPFWIKRSSGNITLGYGTGSLIVNSVASNVNGLTVQGGATGNSPVAYFTGTDTNVNGTFWTKGTGVFNFSTGADTSPLLQFQIAHVASANRYVIIRGSNGARPSVGTSAGSLGIVLSSTESAIINTTGIQIIPGTAIPAGGTAGTGIMMSSTTNFGIFFGSGAPTLSAAQGSFYQRSDGTSTTRAYVNTNGSTGWTPVITADAIPEVIQVAVSDETTPLATGTAKVTFRMPYAFTLTGVRGSLSSAGSSTTTVDVNKNGTTVLSTKLNIDSPYKTSLGMGTTQPVISSASFADDDEVTIDIDSAGYGAMGLKVSLIGIRV